MSQKEKDVELIPDSSVASGWRVKHGTKSGTNGNDYPKVGFSKDSGPHLVVLTLPQNSPATFNATDPIWVAPGTTSPTKSGIDAQIADWAVLSGGKTLVLLDRNSGNQTTLSYRIKADNYVPVLDPIIDNGGGIGHVFNPNLLLIAGGVSVLIAAVFFFIGRAFQRNLK